MSEPLLDALPEPAILLAADARITAANDLAAAMFGSAEWLLDSRRSSAGA